MNRSIINFFWFSCRHNFYNCYELTFFNKKPIDLPPIVSVELIQITDKTNIPFAPKAKKN